MKAFLFWIYILAVYSCGAWIINCEENVVNQMIASVIGIALAAIGVEYAKKVSK